MDLILTFFITFWNLTISIGLYVLIGLIFVGIVHLYISEEWIKKHLGQDSRYAALKGALYGIPLPLCSCGVIPLATSLRKKGASNKAVTSFFITTPMTGIDSIIATYGVFGLPMALLRVISSFISGVLAGVFVKEEPKVVKPANSFSFSASPTPTCSDTSCGCHTEANDKPVSSFQKAYDYALYEVFADIAKPMFLGLVLATLFMMVMPENLITYFSQNLLLTYLLVLLLALPLYVCSISAIPIALSFFTMGLSAGAAFIFLAAAPATNIITAGIIKKILGMRTLIVYLVSIILTTLLFAILIDTLLPSSWFHYEAMHLDEKDNAIENVTGGIFLVMMLYFIFKSMLKK